MTPRSPWDGVSVVVLGATGFIGRWVARALYVGGAKLCLVVRNETAARTLFGAIGVEGELVAADLTEPGGLPRTVTGCKPAANFNLSGYGVDPTEREPRIASLINTDLPVALVKAMRDNGDRSWAGQQIIHAGSALEYGTAAGDLAETTRCTPTTLYGQTKLEGTEQLIAAGRELGIRTVTGRLFTVYGQGEHAGRLLPSLLEKRRGSDAIALTAGLQQRDFTYVADVVEGLLRLGVQGQDDLGVVNVATGRLATVRHFAEIAAEVLGIDAARLDFGALPSRPEEMHHDPVNVGRLQALTGWTPAIAIEEGVRRTLQPQP